MGAKLSSDAGPGAGAQGTVNFNNRVAGSNIDAPIFVDTIGGTKAEGDQYRAQLYAGPSPDSMQPVGAPVAFRTGPGAGYLNPAPDATRLLPVPPGSTAYAKLVVWDSQSAADYEQARARGERWESQVITLKTGGDGAPPSLPAPLVGLRSFARISASASA